MDNLINIPEEVDTLPRKELQRLCKAHGIRANSKTVELISALETRREELLNCSDALSAEPAPDTCGNEVTEREVEKEALPRKPLEKSPTPQKTPISPAAESPQRPSSQRLSTDKLSASRALRAEHLKVNERGSDLGRGNPYPEEQATLEEEQAEQEIMSVNLADAFDTLAEGVGAETNPPRGSPGASADKRAGARRSFNFDEYCRDNPSSPKSAAGSAVLAKSPPSNQQRGRATDFEDRPQEASFDVIPGFQEDGKDRLPEPEPTLDVSPVQSRRTVTFVSPVGEPCTPPSAKHTTGGEAAPTTPTSANKMWLGRVSTDLDELQLQWEAHKLNVTPRKGQTPISLRRSKTEAGVPDPFFQRSFSSCGPLLNGC
eukprot:gene2276-2995_t